MISAYLRSSDVGIETTNIDPLSTKHVNNKQCELAEKRVHVQQNKMHLSFSKVHKTNGLHNSKSVYEKITAAFFFIKCKTLITFIN